MRRHLSTLLSLILIALLSGCVTRAPVANRALGQFQLGNREKAWEMVSKEMAHPTVSSQEDLCGLHGIFLQILSNITRNDYAPADPDPLAKRSYEYVMKICGEFKGKQEIMENNYAGYFLNTRRPGLAVPHLKKAILMSENDYVRMCNEVNLALAYADMGQFDLRDHHRLKAIQIGREYFKTERTYKFKMNEGMEFRTYKSILESRMDNLSWSEDRSGALPEMHRLWEEIKELNKKWVSKQTQYIAYSSKAQNFATAGDTAFARKLLNEARVLTNKYPSKNPAAAALDLQVCEAKILNCEGKHKEAAPLWEDWINRFPEVAGKTMMGNSFRLAGLAQESAQNYDLAIEYLKRAIEDVEEMRSSFEVESRGQVLSGLVVTSYWGLMRSYAARYLKFHDEKDFLGALSAERMLRARQFGELTGIDGKESEFSLSALNLKPDELLLDYVFTDSAIVISAISPDWHGLFMIPYDAKSFNEALQRVRSQLSKPEDTKGFIEDLQKVSETIIPKPVVDRLAKVKKLIVMPDGYLNGIPFSIISKSSRQYYPIIQDHEVVLTPSTSYLIAQRSSKEQVKYDKGMLALADPNYGALAIPEAYQDDTKEIYTRAVSQFNLFTPLPETRMEVERISKLLGTASSTLLLGNEASKTNLKAQQLKGYRYLHFATHGILGNQIPDVYEPALVLAADAGQGNFLKLSEIEELKLNSDLTVLSACDTGSGKYYTGEGVMGLSRGFLVAGSKSVLASLWPIDSMSTVEFMTRFYQYLQSGKSKPEALRLAQLEMMSIKDGKKMSIERGVKLSGRAQKQTDISHPYYWAAFVLTGE